MKSRITTHGGREPDSQKEDRSQESSPENLLLFETLAKSAPVGIFQTDQEGKGLYTNDRWREMSGLTAEEALGDGWLQAIHPEDRQRIATEWTDVVRKGLHGKAEFRFLRPDGTVTWVYGQATPIRNSTGEVAGHIGTMTDITDHKRTQQELERTAEHLKILFEYAPDATYLHDFKGTFIDGNQAAEIVTGYRREEVIGKTFFELNILPPSQVPKAAALLARNALGYPTGPAELTLRRKDGNKVTVEVRTYPIRFEEQRLVLGIARDISDRKQAEESLRLSQFSLDHSSDAAFWVAPDGRFLYVSDASCRLLGYSREELLSMAVWDVNMDFSAERWLELWAQIKQKGSMRVESLHRAKDGRMIPVEISTNYLNFGGTEYSFAFVRDISERKQAEEALRLSQEMFSKAFSASPAILTVSTLAEGRFLDVNQTFLRVMGFDREEVIGRTSRDLNLWDDSTNRADLLGTLEERGSVQETELNFRTKSGDLRLMRFSAEKITVAGDPCLLAVAEDITERRRAERELIDKEERLRALFDGSPGHIFIKDLDGRYLTVNHQVESMLGKQSEDILGNTDHELFPSELADKFRQTDLEALNAGGPITQEIEFHVQGESRRHIVWKYPLFDARRKPYAICGIATDITERKQAEDALRRSEASLAEAQRLAHLGNWDWDIVNNTLFWSDEIYRIFGLTPQSFGATYEAFLNSVHPEDRAFVKQSVDDALYNREPYSIDHRVVLPDGSERVVHEHAEVLFGEEQQPVRMKGTVQDVTEQRSLEEKLRQAQKMEAIGQLAGGVAHDFNNLLMIIGGHCEVLQTGSGTAAGSRKALEEIKHATERAASLTHQLLAFGRRQVLNPIVLDLNDLVSKMEGMLSRVIGENIELATELGSGLGKVRADMGQIEQVILNLAINACDAMARGGKLTIRTDNFTVANPVSGFVEDIQPGRYVCLIVTDTGQGMDEAALPNIFEPFYTTKEIGAGTGLGLATVFGIVKQSGGYISVDSKPGQGTSFKLYFPAVEEAGKPDAERAQEQESPRGSETILVIEDEDGVKRLIRQFLELKGYKVLEAENAHQSLEIVRQHKGEIQLLITDVVMPGELSGPEAAERIMGLRPRIKTIYVSGYTHDMVAKQGGPNAGARFLQKPFSIEALAQKVREVLDAQE